MTARVIHADCLDAMRAMPDASIDAIVTDPPYGLSFMGRDWDHGVPGVPFWIEALRVAKPGAHLVAFGGTRTYHRLACAIEDAGWEVRDCLSWLYGSGFPKSLDVSKAIDKAAGAEREVVGRYTPPNGKAWNLANDDSRPGDGGTMGSFNARSTSLDRTAPSTDAARQWQGWGTALKPAWEPIILARKPLIGTVAANVTAHGAGAINVDACRIGWRSAEDAAAAAVGYATSRARKTVVQSYAIGKESRDGTTHYDPHALAGRWPSNVVLDEEAAAMLDEQTGISTSRKGNPRASVAPGVGWGMTATGAEYDDSGGASRFFYTAKASRSERNAGCDAIDARPQDPTRDVDAPGGNNPRNRGAAARVNSHPTVKPVALMRWLVRMVTPPGGVVLDPFCGSGTTLVAAIEEGFDCVGVEREAEYVAIIEARVAAAQQRPQRVEKPKTRRTPRPVVVATTAPPAPVARAPLPGQLALTWEVA